MLVDLYVICVWNWNWWLTQDHFLIKHWSQRTHRGSAPVVGLEEYSLGLVSRYSTVRSGTLTWCEWGLCFRLQYRHSSTLASGELYHSLRSGSEKTNRTHAYKLRTSYLNIVLNHWRNDEHWNPVPSMIISFEIDINVILKWYIHLPKL